MVQIVRKMRVEPWLLQDAQVVRDSVRTARSQAPRRQRKCEVPTGWGR